VATLEASRRPLTEAERRLLRLRVGASAERSRQVSRRAPIVTISIVIVLWLLTLLASDAPWWVITGLWALGGGAIWLWVWRDVRKDARFETEWTTRLESALRRNTADVFDVRARGFVELEEFEDEGACYAFALDDERVVFVIGQEFCAAARFPSLDFSLVYALDEAGNAVDVLIDKRGPKTAAARTISCQVKHGLEVPEHLAVVMTTLDGLEDRLRARVQSPR
jgi:hypothetical protein